MNFRLKEQLEWILSMVRWILLKKETFNLDEGFIMTLEDIKTKLESLVET